MRLIDAEELVDMLYDNEFAALCPLDEVSGVVDACPTVDAVVVTRCRDCQYRGMIYCPAVHETMGNGLVSYASDEAYCWRGRPKVYVNAT